MGTQYRLCRRCKKQSAERNFPYRLKFVGRENYARWIFRHFMQLICHGLKKSDPERYISLCEKCAKEYCHTTSLWLGITTKEFLVESGAGNHQSGGH